VFNNLDTVLGPKNIFLHFQNIQKIGLSLHKMHLILLFLKKIKKINLKKIKNYLFKNNFIRLRTVYKF